MNAVLKGLLEITLYSLVIAGAIMLFRLAFRKSISPKLQYFIWALLILRLAFPITIESGLHFEIFFPKQSMDETHTLGSKAQPASSAASGAIGGLPGGEAPAEPTRLTPGADTQAEEHSMKPVPDAASKAAEIPWQSIAMGVWIAGVAAVLGVTIKAKRKFNNTMLAARVDAGGLAEDMHSIAEGLGLQRCPRLIVVCLAVSPSLTWIKGELTVILPLSLADDRAACRLALMHELTHKKRKDHYVCLLLTMLRVVYWFNPVVWFCFHELQSDMETACDADVLSRLHPSQKRGYLSLILLLFQRSSSPVLGMASHASKRLAKKRIKGAFMKRKSGKSAKAGALLLAGAMLVCCFTTACQPTPEEAAVVNRNDGKMQDAIGNSDPASVRPLDVPEEWAETLSTKLDNLKINVDAEIFGTDLAAYPVAEVTAKSYTEQEISDFINYFAADKKLFDASEETKADVERLLIEAKRGTEIDGVLVPPEPDDPYIKQLEEKLANMQDDARKYIEPMLAAIQSGRMAMYAGVELEDGNEAALSIVNNTLDGTGSYICYRQGTYWDPVIAGFNDVTLEPPADITAEDAVQQAEKTVQDLGFANLNVYAVFPSKGEKTNGCGSIKQSYVSPGGWLVVFTRSVQGMPVVDIQSYTTLSYSGGYDSADNLPAYVAPWKPERLLVYVDAKGVQSFSYEGGCTEKSIVRENTQLLSFDEIQQRMAQQMFYRCAWLAEPAMQQGSAMEGSAAYSVHIGRIELGGALINKKDDPETALIVPAWYFYYDVTQEGSEETFNDGVLILNAIDGSRIESFLAGRNY